MIRQITQNGIIWIDIENPTHKEISEVTKDYSFHPLHLEACFAKGQLDRVEIEENYVFIILHSPDFNKKEDKIITSQICAFLGKDYLITITVHESTSSTISQLFKEVDEDAEKKNGFFNSSGNLLYNIFNYVIQDEIVLYQQITQELDEMEDLIYDASVSGAHRISKLRQKIIKLRRVVGPSKNVLHELATSQNDLIDVSLYYKSAANEVNRLWENLDEVKETIEVFKDADFIDSTEKTNDILAVLTLIFTFTIPATVIGTFFGMNVLIPGGLVAGTWTFLGPYTTFYLIIFVSLVSALLMFWYFKNKRWW